MQLNIKRWPHNWLFYVLCTVYLALAIEPKLLYACFGYVLADVPAFPAHLAFAGKHLSRPSGLLWAVTGLLSQCFYSSWAGSLVIVATALGLSELARRHFKAAGFGSLPTLTCLPMIMLMLIYSRYQHPLLGVLVVCLGLFSAWAYVLASCRHPKLGAPLLCVITVVTFWIGGTGALIVFLAVTLIHILYRRKLGSVGKLRRRPESEQFFRLAKTAKQAMLVSSSMQPDAARWKKGRSKPDRVFRQSLVPRAEIATVA